MIREFNGQQYVLITGLKRDLFTELRSLDLLTGLAHIQVEFNTDSQEYEMAIRNATIEDL